jgi:lipopolysaccharide transport system ATP-binding protein
MSDTVVRAKGLGKQYRIGERRRYRTLREALAEAAAAPLRWLRRRRAPAADAGANRIWALRDVSFEVRRGEVIGVIGRNGAGKSTLLKVLSQITEPTAGEAEIRGRVGSLLEVGTGFHPELTGRENVFLNGAILGMRRAEIARKFDAITAFAEVEKFLDTPVKRYSSGMHMRLAFAVAAHLEPEVLIVDEVLAVGDAAFQKKCMGKIGEVAKSDRTVLFVSHNMAAINQLCGRAVLLREGRLQAVGPVAQVSAEYMKDGAGGDAATFDLASHPARRPGHASIIRKLSLSGEDGRPRCVFRPQERMALEIGLRLEKRLREPALAVAIEDAYGRRITTMASYLGGRPLPAVAGSVVVRCVTEELRLGAGRYLLSVSIADRMTGLLDSLDGAAWFEVEWDNNYGNGEAYHPVFGPVLRQSQWEIAEGADEAG